MNRAVLGTLAMLLGASSVALADDRPRAFLELFTSQGCAACPPADALVDDLARQEGVISVTHPVKIWDFLGWADTLATDNATKRQISYSVARGDRDVYTPQMVLNGTHDVLGSDRAAIQEAVDTLGADPLPLPIALDIVDGALQISVGDADIDVPQATLWLMVIEAHIQVPIGAGENGGRRLTYHNVVGQMRPIGIWKGYPMTFDLPLMDIEKGHATGSIVVAQVENFKGPGPIIGAAKIDRLFPARSVD